jgi:GNAT superfamily N-acetyltransferase
MEFEQLQPLTHNRKDFDCGVEALNQYIQKVANQDQKRNLTKIYVLADNEEIIGYYSISAHSVMRDYLPEDIKSGTYKDIPFLLLGRLAVDKRHQGKGYGDALIFHAFKTTMEAAEKVGILGILVDAKDEKAASFYEGFGFRRLLGTLNRLVLPISVISKLM